MKLMILFGDAAVGKMTVGQELMKITDFRLFHNHMTIEPVIEIFGQYQPEPVRRLREVIFEEFAKSDCYGLIFTYMWAFDQPSDWDYIAHVVELFRKEKPDTLVYYVELNATQQARLERNTTENRLRNKPSKRNIEWSNQNLITSDQKYRLISNEGEIPFPNYLRIDNTHLSPSEAAAHIKAHFSLTSSKR